MSESLSINSTYILDNQNKTEEEQKNYAQYYVLPLHTLNCMHVYLFIACYYETVTAYLKCKHWYLPQLYEHLWMNFDEYICNIFDSKIVF